MGWMRVDTSQLSMLKDGFRHTHTHTHTHTHAHIYTHTQTLSFYLSCSFTHIPPVKQTCPVLCPTQIYLLFLRRKKCFLLLRLLSPLGWAAAFRARR